MGQTSSSAQHWRQVYGAKDPTEVSWFEPVPASSLAMVDELGLPHDAPIVDIGAGASSLTGELVGRGYTDVTAVDISAEALATARSGLGSRAGAVKWVVADLRDHDFGRRFALWHDRALFHFMVDERDRRAYVETMSRSLEPGAHAIVATFGPQGPTSCSGLPVVRYDADALDEALGDSASLVSSHLEEHVTPSGNRQQFLFARLEAGA